MPCKPLTVTLTPSDKKELEAITKRHNSPQQMAKRAGIILHAAMGQNNAEIARALDISIKMVRQWRRRWVTLANQALSVQFRLSDSYRKGAPPTFSLEQQVECIAIACSDPMESGRPISHWSAAELADELIQRGIVKSISARQVRRWLNEADLKPHQSRYWLFPPARSRV